MENLFQNRYRIQSARLKNWDYSQNGWYFITICTKHRMHYFGKTINNRMELNAIGQIVFDEWYKTREIRKNVLLDEFVIMPDHIHGIIQIQHNDTIKSNPMVDVVETSSLDVSTTSTIKTTKPKLQKNSIGSIICQFKSKCTKRLWKLGNTDFGWQSRYYDHIIRNEHSLKQIRNYIKENPEKNDNNFIV